MRIYSTENSEEPVTDFPDQCINLAFLAILRGNFMFLSPYFCLSDGSIYTDQDLAGVDMATYQPRASSSPFSILWVGA